MRKFFLIRKKGEVAPCIVLCHNMSGLSWTSHRVFFLVWSYTAVGVGMALYYQNQEREEGYQKKRKFWMHSGHYKHPWELPNQPYNDPRAVEKLKGTDYVEFSKFPKGF